MQFELEYFVGAIRPVKKFDHAMSQENQETQKAFWLHI